jgi:hypothetical protein
MSSFLFPVWGLTLAIGLMLLARLQMLEALEYEASQGNR